MVEVADGSVRTLETVGSPFDARLDPTGARVAYASDGALRVHDLASGSDDVLADDDDPDVRWGVAEFIAAEEMERLRGFWWAPDGTRVLACRVDDRPVGIWHIASPIDPAAAPARGALPPGRHGRTRSSPCTCSASTAHGSTSTWDRDAFEYVVAVSWTDEGPPLALVQSRDQRDVQVLAIDLEHGTTEVVWADHDERWTHITEGVPAWLPGGRLLTVGHRDDTRTLLIDGEPVIAAGPAGRRGARGGRRRVVARHRASRPRCTSGSSPPTARSIG